MAVCANFYIIAYIWKFINIVVLTEEYLHKIILEEISVVPNIYNVIWLFGEYNKKCFNNELPRPLISLFHSEKILGRFTCDFDEDGYVDNPRIEISDSYEYTEQRLSEVLVHEMIHYYLAYTQLDTNLTHGEHFNAMANYISNNFGLNITETIDIADMNKVKHGNWFTNFFK